jgi:Tetratricopeptide repeat
VFHEWDTAVHLLETAVGLYEQTGPAPEWLIEGLGDGARQGGHFQTAVTAYEKLFGRKRGRLGDKHPEVLVLRHNLAASYRLAGFTGHAIGLQEQLLADSVEVLGPNHRDEVAFQQTGAEQPPGLWAVESCRDRLCTKELVEAGEAMGSLKVYETTNRIASKLTVGRTTAVAPTRATKRSCGIED